MQSGRRTPQLPTRSVLLSRCFRTWTLSLVLPPERASCARWHAPLKRARSEEGLPIRVEMDSRARALSASSGAPDPDRAAQARLESSWVGMTEGQVSVALDNERSLRVYNAGVPDELELTLGLMCVGSTAPGRSTRADSQTIPSGGQRADRCGTLLPLARHLNAQRTSLT